METYIPEQYKLMLDEANLNLKVAAENYARAESAYRQAIANRINILELMRGRINKAA